MLKRVAQNKYKLMAVIVGLYLVIDVLQHKGQARVLFPKNYPAAKASAIKPLLKNKLLNTGKNWKKGVNVPQKLNEIDASTPGFECDIYFDTSTGRFSVHHDPGKAGGYFLDQMLLQYHTEKLSACIWLDLKNLAEDNAAPALKALLELQDTFNLHHKILVESGRADLLSSFTDSGFFTSCYVPFFNPYKMNDGANKQWAHSLSALLKNNRVDALSGYYFQTGFLQHYFPQYPVLTWVDQPSFSLVSTLFQKKIASDKGLYIILTP